MQLLSWALLALPSIAWAAPTNCPPLTSDGLAPILPRADSLDSKLQRRTSNDVQNHMAIVATNLIRTTHTVNTLQPNDPANGLIAAQVAEQALVLSQHVRDVIATANASAPFDNHGSACQQRANNYHFGLITNMTNSIVDKKSSWVTAIAEVGDVSLTIHNAILTEKNLVLGPGGFAEAVRRKTLSPYTTSEETMGPFFDEAASHFKSCSGKTCLPALIPVLQAYEGPP